MMSSASTSSSASSSSSASDDELASMASEEHDALASTVPALEEKLAHLLLPSDDADDGGAILEIRAGAGGDEAARFAANLARMYDMFARRRGWTFERMTATTTDEGGYKDVTFNVSGDDVYGTLKYESGVHRRVRRSSRRSPSLAFDPDARAATPFNSFQLLRLTPFNDSTPPRPAESSACLGTRARCTRPRRPSR
jgi:peptide chain release factor 1